LCLREFLMTDQTILEIKETLTGERKEFPCTPCALAEDEVVILYKVAREGRVEDVVLPAGTLSLGYFWATRPYNAYHWVTPKGKTIGLYFNISEGADITPQRVIWRDLVVDVLVTPDGRCRVLDEDELPVEMDVSLRQRINGIREELVRQHETLLADIEARSVCLLRELGLIGLS
jgi:protein associated with RNAse G/E